MPAERPALEHHFIEQQVDPISLGIRSRCFIFG